jgi:hypothetical protein
MWEKYKKFFGILHDSKKTEKPHNNTVEMPTETKIDESLQNEKSIYPKESYKLAEDSLKNLNLKIQLGDEFFYQSLPLCVIDAVYSLNQKYTATQNVVQRFCERFKLQTFRDPREKLPAIDRQFSINDLLTVYKEYSFQEMAEDIYKNRRPTSPRGGILRSEAIYHFSKVLQKYRINYLQDVAKIIADSSFERDILTIPGQGSGVSLRYFYMLAGSDDYLKPDVWIIRYVEEMIIRKVTIEECENLLKCTADILKEKFPLLTPRQLDYAIWVWQHERDR